MEMPVNNEKIESINEMVMRWSEMWMEFDEATNHKRIHGILVKGVQM
jgi:hypothetical protein